MREITKELLIQCAHNLMFDMKDEEYDTLFNEFSILKQQMALIGSLKGIDDETPMTFPFPVTTDFLREDEEGEVLPVEDVLRNAKDVLDGQIKLPKVVG